MTANVTLPLTVQNLTQHTLYYPPSARYTVQLYVYHQQHQVYPVIELPQSKTNSNPSSTVLRNLNGVTSYWYDETRPSPNPGATEKRTSIVTSMRPRMSHQEAIHPPKGRAGETEGGGRPSKDNLSLHHFDLDKSNLNPKSIRKGADKENVHPEEHQTHILKAKEVVQDVQDASQRRVELDSDRQQLLEARKLRRREKAVIVKDRTQSAAAIGAKAGRRVKEPLRQAKEKGDETASDIEPSKSHKRRRRTADEKANHDIQANAKSSNLGKSRLTLRPPQIGVFHKGTASVRKTVEKQQLAFQELPFLNEARPPADISSDSNPSDLLLKEKDIAATGSVPRMQRTAAVTYKSKRKRSAAPGASQIRSEDSSSLSTTESRSINRSKPMKSSHRRRRWTAMRAGPIHIDIKVLQDVSAENDSLTSHSTAQLHKHNLRNQEILTRTNVEPIIATQPPSLQDHVEVVQTGPNVTEKLSRGLTAKVTGVERSPATTPSLSTMDRFVAEFGDHSDILYTKTWEPPLDYDILAPSTRFDQEESHQNSKDLDYNTIGRVDIDMHPTRLAFPEQIGMGRGTGNERARFESDTLSHAAGDLHLLEDERFRRVMAYYWYKTKL